MGEDETERVDSETKLLDRGVLTLNEVRRRQEREEVPWGNTLTPRMYRRTTSGPRVTMLQQNGSPRSARSFSLARSNSWGMHPVKLLLARNRP